MEQMTVTAKIQISVDTDSKVLLDETMSVYSDACNFVSDYVFHTHDLKQFSLNKVLYSTLREKFGLKSQMAQSVFKTVIARYKTILENQKDWIKPSFKKPQYDLVWNRDYSLNQDKFSVGTLDGRIKVDYSNKGMEKYFNKSIYRFGTAKVVYKHNKFFLHIAVSFDIDEVSNSDICNVVGHDRGIRFITTSYNSKGQTSFISGNVIKQKRSHYKLLRKQLQQVGTSSSRRRLKAIGQRENRWMQDVNHCVSKALVEQNPKGTLHVIEDLSNIRNATEKVRVKDRYVTVSWSYYDLEQKLIYKAQRLGQKVIKVDAHYTSQTCPKCGHIEKNNRDKKNHIFCCCNCGYKSNDDRIGAMNLYHKGIEYLVESQVGTSDL